MPKDEYIPPEIMAEAERDFDVILNGLRLAKESNMEVEFVWSFGEAMSTRDDVPSAVAHAIREWDL